MTKPDKLAVIAKMDIFAGNLEIYSLYSKEKYIKETLHTCIIAGYIMLSNSYSPLCWNMCPDPLRSTGLHLKQISTNHNVFSHFLCKNKQQKDMQRLNTHCVLLTAHLRLSTRQVISWWREHHYTYNLSGLIVISRSKSFILKHRPD